MALPASVRKTGAKSSEPSDRSEFAHLAAIEISVLESGKHLGIQAVGTGYIDLTMAYAQKARALQDEFKAATGVRPKYPKSRAALQDLCETLNHYIATQDNVKAADAWKQAAKDFAGEFARLSQADVADDFDLDRLTSTGELEGERCPAAGVRQEAAPKRGRCLHLYLLAHQAGGPLPPQRCQGHGPHLGKLLRQHCPVLRPLTGAGCRDY